MGPLKLGAEVCNVQCFFSHSLSNYKLIFLFQNTGFHIFSISQWGGTNSYVSLYTHLGHLKFKINKNLCVL